MPSEDEMSNNQAFPEHYEEYRKMPLDEITPEKIDAAIKAGGMAAAVIMADDKPKRLRRLLKVAEIEVALPDDNEDLQERMKEWREQDLGLEEYNLRKLRRETASQQKK